MARARNIKPGFFTNELLVELDFAARLLFIGLWTEADREGRLEDRPKKIKMAIFPADSVEIDPMLNDLQRLGFIDRYESNGLKVIQIVNWAKHQNPHHTEKASFLPARETKVEPAVNRELTVNSPLEHGGNLADSLIHRFTDSLIPDSNTLDASASDTSTENEIQTSTPEKPKSKKPDYPGWFEEIWNAYPQRNGSNDKRRAFHAAQARIKSGKEPALLMAAVNRYKAFVIANGRIGTEYTMQAATFFGPGEHIDNPWVIVNSVVPNFRMNSNDTRSRTLAQDLTDTDWAR